MLVFFKDAAYKVYSIIFLLFVLPPFNFWPHVTTLNTINILRRTPNVAKTIESKFESKFLQNKNESEKRPTVEVLTYQFAPYALKNNLNLIFNPIFALYNAHSNILDKLSAQNYAQQKADFLIIEDYMDIDNKNMIMSTPETYRKVKEYYNVAHKQGNTLILKKSSTPNPTKKTMHAKQTIQINQKISVPEGAQTVKMNVKLSLFGKIMLALYKIHPLYLKIYTQNADGKTTLQFVEVIRTSLKNGIYIGHLIKDTDTLADWINEKPLTKNKITALEIYPFMPMAFQNEVEIEWEK